MNPPRIPPQPAPVRRYTTVAALIAGALVLLLAGCQTAGVQLAGRNRDGSIRPAHLRLPVDADHVVAHLTQNSCDLEITGLRSSPAILAQGQAAHEAMNGVQGIIGTAGAAIATKGATGIVK